MAAGIVISIIGVSEEETKERRNKTEMLGIYMAMLLCLPSFAFAFGLK